MNIPPDEEHQWTRFTLNGLCNYINKQAMERGLILWRAIDNEHYCLQDINNKTQPTNYPLNLEDVCKQLHKIKPL